MADNYPEEKSDYRAPLLTGTDNYNWWKGRMETFLSRDPLVLRVVQKGPYVFLDKDGKDKDIDDLTSDELIKVGYNGKAKNSFMNGLNQAEHDKLSSLKSAKEIWDALETYHEGSTSLKKVKLSNLMNEFGNFKLREGETIKESQARFQVNINALERLGKNIPQDEINMKVLSAVPFIYEPEVTYLESSSNLDTMDHLSVFVELEQFETKIHESKMESVKALVDKMKNLALHSSSKLTSDAESESDEELALMSRKIKKMIEKRNKLKKGKAFGAKRESRDSKDDACFECGKKGHFKRDCYKLKNKPKQLATSRDRKKSKALLTWSDDEDSASDD
ncbi:CCHC-type domain-containing protein [Heracleum sosnowskyi]|uniref:CCHC-type domain-containing protein n=1 Tax=Heracleum sosnowskyi TaxID=360622 RepID=A0AAD8MAE8_9APIA|nr:CCHC-type domain-containing protein [Heracleum sosnowskyi]